MWAMSRTKNPSRPILWRDIVPKISPAPENTIVFEYNYSTDSKEYFERLLEHGASLFPELFENQWPYIHFPEVGTFCLSQQ